MPHRRVTSRLVAERAGVSPTTVSLVLNDRAGASIPEETRRRVREVAARLGYRPHASARALARGSTDVLGIVISDEPNFGGPDQFFQRQMLHGLIHAIFRHKRNPMLYANPSPRPPLQGEGAGPAAWQDNLAEQQLLAPGSWLLARTLKAKSQEPGARSCLSHDPPDLDSFADGRADGFLLVAPGENDPLVAFLEERRLPFVALATRLETSVGSWVDADNETGAAVAVAHLCDAGHTRIAHLSGPPGNVNAAARLAAFRRVMAARNLPVPDAYVRDGRFLSDPGEIAAAELLSLPQRPTAIFAADDNMALGAYRAARRLRLRIPEDLSLVGFDDTDHARTLDPPLTTIRQPLLAMADAAVELLVARLSQPDRTHLPRVLPTELVVRGSVAPPAREPREGG